MPLFGSAKPRTTVRAYAEWFHTFGQVGESGIDPELAKKAWSHAIVDLVSKEDERFAQTDRDLFTSELIALRAEIFGLAWGHAFHGKDRHLLGEGTVAKSALSDLGLWDRAEKYNQASARSSNAGLPTGEIAQRGAIGFQNSWRMSMFESWTKKGFDADVVARIINRIFTQESWNNGATLRHLTAALIAVLGFGNAKTGDVYLNKEALTALQYPLLDIYQGSREGIAKVEIKAD